MQITVSIATYNRSEFLKVAINSVLVQTYQDFIIFISDNASTDDTESIVKQYNDKRIIYHKHERNIGLQANWEFCLTQAPGEYVAFLEDDNYFLESHLAEASHFMKETGIGFYFTNSNISGGVYMNGIKENLIIYPQNINICQVIININIPASSVVIKKEATKNIPFNLGKDLWCNDRLYWRSIILNEGFICNHKSNIYYRVHDENMTSYYLKGSFVKRARASAQNRFVDRYFLEQSIKMKISDIRTLGTEFESYDFSEYQHILPALFHKHTTKDLKKLAFKLLNFNQQKITFRYSNFFPPFIKKFLFSKIDSINSIISGWYSPKF